MNTSDTGPEIASADPVVQLAGHVVRLSPSEYDLAAILEFDPEASIAPGSITEAWGGQLTCPVPISHFSFATWCRLVCGFEDLDHPSSTGELRVWNFLGRRRTVGGE